MQDFKSFRKQLYEINNDNFNDLVLELFKFQAENNPVYRNYLETLGVNWNLVTKIKQIPFLPISFFKNHEVKTGSWVQETVFESSGTTSGNTSRHYVEDLQFYYLHSLKNFEYFYGTVSDYDFLALLPSYLERENSSLVHMIQHLIEQSGSSNSGYFLYNYDELVDKLLKMSGITERSRKIMVIGISFALLEVTMQKALPLSDMIVVETGGMKGRRKEMIREELHFLLRKQWHLPKIHSEYGMTELMSQAYSFDGGKFRTPPWMKVMIREISDPFGYTSGMGGMNVIDLANIHSCAFIETQDIGIVNDDGTFEVIGRFDYSDIRGCNLLLN